MPYRFLISFLILSIVVSLFAQPQKRELQIIGLKIFNEKALFKTLELERYENYEIDEKTVIDLIERFYQKLGFTLVTIYIKEQNDEFLSLYVDEGRLGKIILKNLDDIGTLWMRYYNFKIIPFSKRDRIFNIHNIEKKIQILKEKRGYKGTTYSFKPVKNYRDAFFQFDRPFCLPSIFSIYGRDFTLRKRGISKVTILQEYRLPFFDLYPPRYDLVINVSKSKKMQFEDIEKLRDRLKDHEDKLEDAQKKRKGKKYKVITKFDYGLKINYFLGFIPKVRFYSINTFANSDGLKLGADAGIMYGFDRKFDKPPRITFIKFEMFYFFPPIIQEFFTPYIRGYVYRSKAARVDLGLAEYDYWLSNVMFAPGITFFRKYLIYTGIGAEPVVLSSPLKSNVEKYNFYNSLQFYPYLKYYQGHKVYKYSPGIGFSRSINYLYFAEAGISFNIKPEILGYPTKRGVVFLYDYYFGDKSFHRVWIKAFLDYEFKDRSILSTKLDYRFMWKNPPLYHEAPVSTLNFKGLMKTGYYSKNVFSLSLEYRMSLYRDYLYAGVYNDYVIFEGSGYDLPEKPQFALAFGPTFRVLILDQFEFYFYYGWDYHLPQRYLLGRKKRQFQPFYTFNLTKVF